MQMRELKDSKLSVNALYGFNLISGKFYLLGQLRRETENISRKHRHIWPNHMPRFKISIMPHACKLIVVGQQPQ